MRSRKWAGLLAAACSPWGNGHGRPITSTGRRRRPIPSADITDAFAWMTPDASKVILVMDLTRNADAGSRFSDSVQYVFHTTSSAELRRRRRRRTCRSSASSTPIRRSSAGPAPRPTSPATRAASSGITSTNGKLRVFAGLRNDPFFFNLSGFRETARLVTGAASGLTFDAAGCPGGRRRHLGGARHPAPVGAGRRGRRRLLRELQRDRHRRRGRQVDPHEQRPDRVGGDRHLPALGRRDHDDAIYAHARRSRRPSSRRRSPPAVTAATTTTTPFATATPTRRRSTLDQQIDRMGRAGINTAATAPFFRESVAEEQELHDEVSDAYNSASDPDEWVAEFGDGSPATSRSSTASTPSAATSCWPAARPAGPLRRARRRARRRSALRQHGVGHLPAVPRRRG